MHFFTLALAALSSASVALSLAVSTHGTRPEDAVRRSSSSSPRLIIYTDDYLGGANGGLPTAADLAGYNVLILSFLLTDGPADQVLAWKQLSSSDRTALLKSYNDAGITLMLSTFGSTEQPTTAGTDATSVAKTHAAFVKQYGIQGIDVDYEDMGAMDKQNGKAEQWLIDYTNALRSELPSGQYILTHAPVAPWFSTTAYKTGAYVTVNKKVGDSIDWYNVQFYNQGDTEYTTCTSLITKSGGDFPGTSVKEINSQGGVPFNKIVIGKPSAAYQAENGFINFATLATCISQAGDMGWDAGTMFWEYEKNLGTNLVTTLSKALAAIAGNGGGIPILSTASSAGSTKTSTKTSTKIGATTTASVDVPTTTEPAVTKTTKSAAAPTTTSPSNNETDPTGTSCSGVKAWDADTVYTGGSVVDGSVSYVTYENSLYANKWWSQGDKPTDGGDSDPWTLVKACSSSKRAVVESEPEVARNVSNARRFHNNNKMRKVRVARSNDLS